MIPQYRRKHGIKQSDKTIISNGTEQGFRIGTNGYGNEPLNNKIGEVYFWKNDTRSTDVFAAALYNNRTRPFWNP